VRFLNAPSAPSTDTRPTAVDTLAERIVGILSAGNGSGGRVGFPDELMQRLASNGIKCDTSDFYSAIGQLTAAGRVEFRTGEGIWLVA
jgi:hypothetical protein